MAGEEHDGFGLLPSEPSWLAQDTWLEGEPSTSFLAHPHTPEMHRLVGETALRLAAEQAAHLIEYEGERTVRQIYRHNEQVFSQGASDLQAVVDAVQDARLKPIIEKRCERSLVELEASLSGVRRAGVRNVYRLVDQPVDISPVPEPKPEPVVVRPHRTWLGRLLLGDG